MTDFRNTKVVSYVGGGEIVRLPLPNQRCDATYTSADPRRPSIVHAPTAAIQRRRTP